MTSFGFFMQSVVLMFLMYVPYKCGAHFGKRENEESYANNQNYRDLVIKLVNGRSPYEGRVMVKMNGMWGTICDNKWDDNDAIVVCRTLGFLHGGKGIIGSYFGSGYGPVWFKNMHCKGTEDKLDKCTHSGMVNHECNHSHDAGVICYQKPLNERESTVTLLNSRMQICGTRPHEYKDREPSLSRTILKKFLENKFINKDTFFKILGGRITVYGDYPWQARLQILKANNIDYTIMQCGAVIIDEFWLLTAAHCFRGKFDSQSAVIVGDNDKTRIDFSEQRFAIEKVISHEHFDYDRGLNDIALIKIEPGENGLGIHWNDYAQPACLPVDEEYDPGQKCIITGWGDTTQKSKGNTKGTSAQFLKAAIVPLMEQALCENLYRHYRERMSDKLFCAGYIDGGIDTCQGDSGGPLICKTGDYFTVVGIASWGNGCGKPRSPGVYTRVSAYLPWIERIIKVNSSTIG